MSSELPRVTYSNIGLDFAPVHELLDRELPSLKASLLGKRCNNVIGADIEDFDGRTFDVVSPIDSEVVVGEFVEASVAAVDRAVAAARSAFPAWGDLQWQERVSALRRWRDVLEQRKLELAAAALIEIGKSRMEALGEAEEAVDIVDYYISEMERHDGYRQKLKGVIKGETTESLMRPIGVFAIISPFNFPLALAVNMLTGALITGNTVVFKPSPGCGLTGRLIVDSMLKAGLPEGVVNLVVGGDRVGQAMVSHADIDGIAFTGSNATGMAIFRTIHSSGHARPVIAEMGGKNPAYVTANADLAVAAEGVARSAFGLQGQKCSACSVAYVDTRVRGEFVERLIAFTEGLELGDPRQRGVFMGPVYNEASAGRFAAAVEEARRDGKILSGGERVTSRSLARGHYVKPTIVEMPTPGRLTREELFLPFLAIRSMAGLEEGLAEGNAVDYGLAAGIYTRDNTELKHFLNTAQAGVLYANRGSGATTGAWPGVQSFCGWKGSGVSHKGGLGPHFLPQFMREQSRTLMT